MDDGIVEITNTMQEPTPQVKDQVSSSPENSEESEGNQNHGEEVVSCNAREADSAGAEHPSEEVQKKPRKKMIKQDDESEHRLREWYMCNDAAFKRAMLAARKAGLESFWLGVVKDYTPIPPSYKRYDLAPSLTVTQSVAGECADMGRGY